MRPARGLGSITRSAKSGSGASQRWKRVPRSSSLRSFCTVITATPHNGCDAFIRRSRRDACVCVSTGDGKRLRRRRNEF